MISTSWLATVSPIVDALQHPITVFLSGYVACAAVKYLKTQINNEPVSVGDSLVYFKSPVPDPLSRDFCDHCHTDITHNPFDCPCFDAGQVKNA